MVSILNPHSEDPQAKPQPQVVGQAESMVYEEAANRIVYTDDAVIRQGDIVTKSPEATLTLSSDGSGLEKLEAQRRLLRKGSWRRRREPDPDARDRRLRADLRLQAGAARGSRNKWSPQRSNSG